MTRFFALLTLASAPILVYAQGVITTVAGTGATGVSGDGGPATSAALGAPSGNTLDVAVDTAGYLYIVDGGNRRIRKVNAAGTITTVAGGGSAIGDGGPATGAQIFPGGAAVDSAGNLYFAQGATIRKVNPAGIISTIAGSGNIAYGGDGGPATAAGFNASGVAVDGAGNLYIADSLNSRIRKISPSGIISTVAGNGLPGFSGDGGPATSASLYLPQGLAADNAGNLYFADNSRIRKVDTTGIITTVAGNGSPIGLGEGAPATSTGMVPVWVAVDSAGNLYVVDDATNRIRKVTTGGAITTVAGNGMAGFSGDGGPATSASLNAPSSVAVDSAGNIYIADLNNNRIRKVTSSNPAAPAISASPNAVVFSYTIGSAAPPSQMVALASSGAPFSFGAAASTSSGGDWLSVTPPNGSVPATLTVAANVAGMAAGDYTGTIAIVASGVANSPLNITVELHVRASGAQPPAGAPTITPDGVQNAGGYQSKLAPGAVFVIKGSNLGPSSIVTATPPDYPTTLGGSSIAFTPAGGGAAISARMVYSLDRQLAGVLPSSLAPGTYAV
ncbi:MAG TPA: hypothetical protein VH640_26445, partial [Bryobacteraceae bacterium]